MVHKLIGRKPSPSATSLRYYVYISDTKLDQLFAQVPTKLLKKITVEASIDLKVLQLTLKQNPVEENRIGRLRVVEGFIHKSVEVGAVDDPQQWIEGTMNVRWGPLPERKVLTDAELQEIEESWRTSGPQNVPDYVDSSVVCFVGKTERNYFAMCGSMRHVLGVAPETPKTADLWTFGSAPFAFAKSAEFLLDQAIDLNEPMMDEQEEVGRYEAVARFSAFDSLPLPAALRRVQTNWKAARMPRQNMTFLAKRLSYWPGRDTAGGSVSPVDMGALLTTPLFVAQSD